MHPTQKIIEALLAKTLPGATGNEAKNKRNQVFRDDRNKIADRAKFGEP